MGLFARRKETAELGMRCGAVFKAEEGKESKSEGLGDEHGTGYRFGYLTTTDQRDGWGASGRLFRDVALARPSR